MTSHRRDEHVFIAFGVEAVVRHPDGEDLYDLVLGCVNDVHTVAVADGRSHESAVGSRCALVGPAGERDGVDDLVGCRVDDLEVALRLDGDEKPSAIRRGCYTMNVFPYLDIVDYLQGR